MLAGVVVSTRLGVEALVFYLAAYLLMNLAAFAVITVRERESGLGDDIASLYGTGAARPLLAWPMTIAMLSLAGFPATMGFFGKLYLIEAAVDNGYGWLAVLIVVGSAISLAYYLRVIAAVWMRSPADAERRLAALPGTVRGRPLIAGGSPEADDAPAGGDQTPTPADDARAGGGETPTRAADPAGRDETATPAAEPAEPVPAATDGPIGARLLQPEVVAVAVLCAAATIFFGIYPSPLLDVARDAGAALSNLV
jgi:NADH-quinone oxidoreductase subunit N